MTGRSVGYKGFHGSPVSRCTGCSAERGRLFCGVQEQVGTRKKESERPQLQVALNSLVEATRSAATPQDWAETKGGHKPSPRLAGEGHSRPHTGRSG